MDQRGDLRQSQKLADVCYDIRGPVLEEATGGRVHVVFTRIGGVHEDVPDGWVDRCRAALDEVRASLPTVDLAPLEGVGVLTTSDALAARRPDLVTYVRVAGAGHAESWIVDRPRCAEALAGFLGGLR